MTYFKENLKHARSFLKYLDPEAKPFNLSPGVTVLDEGEIQQWLEVKKSERGMN